MPPAPPDPAGTGSFTVTPGPGDDAAVVLRLSGELDLSSRPVLEAAVTALHLPYGAGLRLDCTDLAFCDSAGLHAVVGLQRQRRAAGGDLLLLGVGPGLRRTLRIAGLEHLEAAGTAGVPGVRPTAQYAIEGTGSVPGARRWLRAFLDEHLGAGSARSDWAADLVLVTSELVTNALLHGQPPAHLCARVEPAHVLVEVTDAGTPSARWLSGSLWETTGRGLGLAAALSDSCGADGGPGGKSVWARVRRDGGAAGCRDGAQAVPGQAAVSPVLAEQRSPVEDAPRAATVRLLGLPVRQWHAARRQHDELLRELHLHGQEHPLPPGLDLRAAERPRGLIAQQLSGAAGGGQDGDPAAEARDVELQVGPALLADLEALAATLDHADSLAAQGRLLAAPTPPGLAALRRWVVDQARAQAAGQAAEPWRGHQPEEQPAP